MDKEKLKAAWGLLCFRVAPHREQTDGFTRRLSDLSSTDLVRMSPVMSETLQAMRYFLPMLPPKNQPAFRRDLAYLQDLQDLQNSAWAAAIAKAEAVTERDTKKFNSLHHGSDPHPANAIPGGFV